LQAITRLFSPRQKKSPSSTIDWPIPYKNYRESTQANQTPNYQALNDRKYISRELRRVIGYSSSPEIPNLSLGISIPSTTLRTANNQIISTRTNGRMSAVNLNDMLDDVDTVMECSMSDTFKFAPEPLLRRLMTPEAAKKVLQAHRTEVKLSQNIILSDLAKFYSDKAFKVFAILTTNCCYGLIEHFYRNSFQDDMLPVRKRRLEQGSKKWEVESCDKGAFDSNKIPEIFRWGPSSPWGPSPYRVDQFCQHWQWPFVPPVFVEGKFRYIFPEEIRLPFTRSGERKDSDLTLYSYVEEKSVHAGHLPKNPVR
jgi:hypothetical protein